MSRPDLPRAAAFGDRPDLPLSGVLDDTAGARERWLTAVALGGQGRYAAAATLLSELVNGRDPLFAALAAAALASHRRQLGGHAAARRLDSAGLGKLAAAGLLTSAETGDPDGADPLGARSDVLLGLAADAVGTGRIAEARRLHAAAPVDAGWRAAIRHGWVAAEIELGAGLAERAVAPAERAAALAAASGSVRHRVKSDLVLGAALSAAGDSERAEAIVSAALDDATAHGLRPLAWPCALVLAGLRPGDTERHHRRAGAILHCVLRHSDPVGRELAEGSAWVPTSLVVVAPNR